MKRIEKLINQRYYYCDDLEEEITFSIPGQLHDKNEELLKWFMEELPEPYELTILELEFAKYKFKDGYRWLAKDEGDCHVYFYKRRPEKGDWSWVDRGSYYPSISGLYDFVKWEDDQPTKLQDLIDNHIITETIPF